MKTFIILFAIILAVACNISIILAERAEQIITPRNGKAEKIFIPPGFTYAYGKIFYLTDDHPYHKIKNKNIIIGEGNHLLFTEHGIFIVPNE